jgi:Uncharacterized protein conserved in bacteria
MDPAPAGSFLGIANPGSTLPASARSIGAMADVRFLPALAPIPAADWDGLHDGSNPFISHAFLHGLELHGCLRPDWGWVPHHATLWEDGRLVAAMPGYLKENSHGEFVFDHAWANAYARHGLDYFPKWLGAVPYSPVTGPRLLGHDDAQRMALLQGIVDHVGNTGLSSAHINFHLTDEARLFDGSWLLRQDVQFHWHRQPGGNASTTSCRDGPQAPQEHPPGARQGGAAGRQLPHRAWR